MCAFCKINIFRKSQEKDLFNCAKQKQESSAVAEKPARRDRIPNLPRRNP